MTPDRWQTIERLYHATLERSPSERDGFLAAACEGDDALWTAVESLIGLGFSGLQTCVKASSRNFVRPPSARQTVAGFQACERRRRGNGRPRSRSRTLAEQAAIHS